MFKSNQGESFKSVGLVVRLRMVSPFPSRLWRHCMKERRVDRLAGSIFQNLAAGGADRGLQLRVWWLERASDRTCELH